MTSRLPSAAGSIPSAVEQRRGRRAGVAALAEDRMQTLVAEVV